MAQLSRHVKLQINFVRCKNCAHICSHRMLWTQSCKHLLTSDSCGNKCARSGASLVLLQREASRPTSFLITARPNSKSALRPVSSECDSDSYTGLRGFKRFGFALSACTFAWCRLRELKHKVADCLRASAVASGCEVEIEWSPPDVLPHPYDEMVSNAPMCEAFRANIATLPGANVPGVGGPSTSSAHGTVYMSAQEEAKLPGGSTDMGNGQFPHCYVYLIVCSCRSSPHHWIVLFAQSLIQYRRSIQSLLLKLSTPTTTLASRNIQTCQTPTSKR